MLVTYPLSPTSDLARARDASSRVASPAWVVTNPVPLGRFSPATDGPGPVLLSGQGPSVPGGALLGVGPHRPPRPRILGWIPDGLSPDSLVPLAPGAFLGGDGVNELPIGEGVPVPVEVGLQVAWGPGGAGPDNET